MCDCCLVIYEVLLLPVVLVFGMLISPSCCLQIRRFDVWMCHSSSRIIQCDHYTANSIGGRHICNPRFADDIDLKGGSNAELQDLINTLVDRAMAYGVAFSTGKNKIMTISTYNFGADISMTRQKLGEVTSFKYLGPARS